MKYSAALWTLIFFLVLVTGGLFAAIGATALAAGASVTTGLAAQRGWAKLDPATQRKMLER